jgi:hypothetical protein
MLGLSKFKNFAPRRQAGTRRDRRITNTLAPSQRDRSAGPGFKRGCPGPATLIDASAGLALLQRKAISYSPAAAKPF